MKHLTGSGSSVVVGCEVAPLLRVVEWWGARVWREGAHHQPAAAVGKKVKFLRRADGAHGTAHGAAALTRTLQLLICVTHRLLHQPPTLTLVRFLHPRRCSA